MRIYFNEPLQFYECAPLPSLFSFASWHVAFLQRPTDVLAYYEQRSLHTLSSYLQLMSTESNWNNC